ncbi:MAG: hypothetical protein OEW75_05020 [Cyclobacteriaceae bacterium]|nr:hypothetical protein [Cyclobacteriaceae bacterium]
MGKHINIIFLLVLVSIFTGCSENDTSINKVDYFPLQTGNFWVYSVDHLVWLDNVSTVYNYEEMDSVIYVDFFENKDFKAIVHRYRKQNLSVWEPIETYSIEKSGNKYILNQNNSLKVILVDGVPMNGTEWISNAFDISSQNVFEYYNGKYISETVGSSLICENCIEVQQRYLMDCVTENFNDYVIFKPDIGPVYQSVLYHSVNQTKTTLGCIDLYIDFGYEETREITNYLIQ